MGWFDALRDWCCRYWFHDGRSRRADHASRDHQDRASAFRGQSFGDAGPYDRLANRGSRANSTLLIPPTLYSGHRPLRPAMRAEWSNI